MAGIISLYRQNEIGVFEADPVKVNAHLSSTIKQMIVHLKKGEEIRAKQLFEATVASPVFAEFIDGEAVREFANVLYSFNFVGAKKVEAVVEVAKSRIQGFSFSLPESPQPRSATAATVDSGPEKPKSLKLKPLDLRCIEWNGDHKSLDNSPVELVDAKAIDVTTLPAWRFGDFVQKREEEDPELAAAIAASLQDPSTDEKAPA